MCKALDAAAIFELIALIVWGFSFEYYKAEGTGKSSIVWPSPTIMGSAADTGCRVCAGTTSYFQLSGCDFGWGGIITVTGCVLTFVTAAVGHCVKPEGIDGLKHGTKEKYVA